MLSCLLILRREERRMSNDQDSDTRPRLYALDFQFDKNGLSYSVNGPVKMMISEAIILDDFMKSRKLDISGTTESMILRFLEQMESMHESMKIHCSLAGVSMNVQVILSLEQVDTH